MRFSILAPVFTLCSALVLTGCATPGGGGQGAAAPSAVPETPLSKTLGVTAINPEDLISYANTVVVPTVYVKLLVEGHATAVQKGGNRVGSNANAVRASAKYKVLGIDKKLAQDIARQAYDDFVTKLRAAGYTVLTYNDIRDREYVKSADREKADATWGMPVESSREGNETYVVAAPSDDQYFKSGFNGGVFNQFISLGKPTFKDATVIIPSYTINAPQVWGETDANTATISANIKTEPSMRLQSANAPWMGAPKVRMMNGIPGVMTQGPVKVSETVGTLTLIPEKVTASSSAANVLDAGIKAISFFGGQGTIKKSLTEYSFTIDRNTYLAGAVKGASDFNAQVAQVATAAKK